MPDKTSRAWPCGRCGHERWRHDAEGCAWCPSGQPCAGFIPAGKRLELHPA